MIHTIDLNFQGLPKAIACFLVPTSDGPVLIETGPHSTLPNLIKGINEAGYQVDEIKHVLLSHIHLDHAGAAWYLATHGAQVYVNELGYPHLENPKRLMASARLIYEDQMDRLWGKMEAIAKEQLVSVVNDQVITIGGKDFTPWYTPGHAKHHLAWQLDHMLFTGDVAGVKIADGLVMPPCPPPDIDIERWIRSIDLIRKLNPEQLYLTHFGIVEDVTKHLDDLAQQLYLWSNWIKPYGKAQTPPDEILEPFKQFVLDQLENSGVSRAVCNTYEAANPSWMSVYGLLRYWKVHGN